MRDRIHSSRWLTQRCTALCVLLFAWLAACEAHTKAAPALAAPSPTRSARRPRRDERFPALAPVPLVVTLGPRAVRALSKRTRERFASNDWRKVRRAAERIESADRAGVATLIAMLRAPRRVPLSNADEVIYPGARRASGSGPVIQYELDWTTDRAGWVLEALTFDDFGFSTTTQPGTREEAAVRRARAVRTARTWWRQHRTRWTRLDAVREALSGTTDRQRRVLHWLRFGTTPCVGFTVRFFFDEVVPMVRGIYRRTRDREVRDLAAEILGRTSE
ncbi:MAG: hypothetical protein JNK05_11965 [Myxococcales bacterium]|nr:hypothetical protein [Myxococcales bacterium]